MGATPPQGIAQTENHRERIRWLAGIEPYCVDPFEYIESLPTQLKACRDYCAAKGLAVAKEFLEAGESAKTADRTQLRALLAYCRENYPFAKLPNTSTINHPRASVRPLIET